MDTVAWLKLAHWGLLITLGAFFISFMAEAFKDDDPKGKGGKR